MSDTDDEDETPKDDDDGEAGSGHDLAKDRSDPTDPGDGVDDSGTDDLLNDSKMFAVAASPTLLSTSRVPSARMTLPSGERAPTPAAFSTVELFESAVRAHSARLLSIARAIVGNRASPEDVVQQAVFNLYKHRERYDWREPGGLLKRATVNEALRLLRRPRMAAVTDEVDAPDRIDQPDERLETNETVQRVRAAIQQLPEHFRAALVLCEYENMSYQQIADTLNASVPQIKTWIHRARRRMEKMLSGYVTGEEAKDE